MNREDFPMLKTNYIYLDNGATTWKPNQVINKITEYYTNYTANAHRGDYDISLKVDLEYENARDIIKEFINAKSTNQISFTNNSTDSLNKIVFGYFKHNLKSGAEVLLTKAEHASNILPWFELKDNMVFIEEALNYTNQTVGAEKKEKQRKKKILMNS